MRFELSGTLEAVDPVVLVYTGNLPFNPLDYIDMGYTNFDVICIGGGGGSGGGIDTSNTGTLARIYGGAGGGGGIQRVRGVLSGLPSSVDVYVGQGGAAGITQTSDPASTTDGIDGGPSTFHGTICQASGGKGGKRAQNNSLTVSPFTDGGRGGLGGTSVAGGGGLGGTSGIPTTTGPGTPGAAGQDGVWDGLIGGGGGGGAGGVGKYPTGVTCVAGTSGGRGAFNASDLSVYSAGGVPATDPNSGALLIVPGIGGGAKASLLSNAPTVYGSGGQAAAGSSGVVVIRLTAV